MMIEKFVVTESGYHPFLIRNGWQVAQLNYTKEQHIDQITKLDVHRQTDEVFIPISGHAVLIAASIANDEAEFEAEVMLPGQIYNIPQDTWHNIAMEKGSEVLIVEKSDTHISDFEFFDLTKDKQKELKNIVNDLFCPANF